jgi:conjugal transfer ATP-binding protein TraC
MPTVRSEVAMNAPHSNPPIGAHRDRRQAQRFPFAQPVDTPAEQFANWLPYSAYLAPEKIFVNRDGMGVMLELMPQSGADERMAEVLVSLYANCPPGTGIQFHLFGSPQVRTQLRHYANLRVEDEDQAEQAKQWGRPARNGNLFRKLARQRVGHLLQGAQKSLTAGFHYTIRDFRLMLSVAFPGDPEDLNKRDELLALRDSISSTLRSASLPNRVCDAADLINWCALFTNPDRISQTDAPDLHYDDGRELRDQIVDFDTIQDPHPSGLTLWKEASPEVLEARFFSIKSFPERFALWQMGSLIGDLMQPALQYSAPFLLTLGVQVLDPNVTKSVVTANHVRATQNAKSKMADVMPDVNKKLQDWTAAADAIDTGGSLVSLYHQLALFTAPNKAVAAHEAANAIWRGRGFQLNADAYMHRQALAGQPADDADREVPQGSRQDAPRHAQDHGQCDPHGAADRRVARHAHPGPGFRGPARPVDDPRHLRQRSRQLQLRHHRRARLGQVGADERDGLVLPSDRRQGLDARPRPQFRESCAARPRAPISSSAPT